MTPTTTQSVAFVKEGLADDPNWSLPHTPEPSEARRMAIRWRVAAAALEVPAPRLLLAIVFRDASDQEVVGTCKVGVFLRVGAKICAASSLSRSAWRNIGDLDGAEHDSLEALNIDAGGDGVVAIRLHAIAAPGAVKVYVTAQQWGAS